MSLTTPMFHQGPSDYRYAVVSKGEHSWWVFREPLDMHDNPLPDGTVVYFARSQADATRWVDRIQGSVVAEKAA